MGLLLGMCFLFFGYTERSARSPLLSSTTSASLQLPADICLFLLVCHSVRIQNKQTNRKGKKSQQQQTTRFTLVLLAVHLVQ